MSFHNNKSVEFRNSIITGFIGDDIDAPEVSQIRKLLRDRLIGGVILFKDNIKDKKNIKNINRSFIEYFNEKQCDGTLPVISIDQEGGFVQRINSKNGFRDFPSAKSAALMHKELISKEYQEMAYALQDIGVNMNFGPVVDLDIGSKVISGYERSFSDSPEIVIDLSSIFIDAMLDHKVTPVIKHFPGHGSAPFDTHLDFTDISNISNEIKSLEITPFSAISKKYKNKICIMLSHLFDNNVDSKYPYSLSINGVEKLKSTCPDVKIISDDYYMGSILKNFGLDEIIEQTTKLSIDYRIFSNNPMASANFYKTPSRVEPIELFG